MGPSKLQLNLLTHWCLEIVSPVGDGCCANCCTSPLLDLPQTNVDRVSVGEWQITTCADTSEGSPTVVST